MFGNSKKTSRIDTSKIDTLIGQNTEIRGDIRFSGGLHVDGKICGNVIADQGSGSVLILSERGNVEGELRVPNVVLNGTVKGDVYASEYMQLAVHANIKGNVYYKVIEMARGAEVNGSLIRHDETTKALAAPQEKAISGIVEKDS